MEIVRFGELYAIPSGNGLSRPTAVRGEGFRMIGMGELFANDIITDIEMDRVMMSKREQETFFVEADDLLFARQSLVAAGAGKCSIVKSLNEPTTYESHLIRVRLDKAKCNPWYYYYLFKLPDNPIKAIVNQCAQAGIRGNELVKIKVPLPKRVEQDRIVNILSAYDSLIEINNKRIKVLEQMAENLYKEWFVRFRFPGHETAEFESGLPKGWSISKLGDITQIKAGGDRPDICSEMPTNGATVPIFSNGIDNEGLYGYTKKPEIEKESITISARGTVGYVFFRRVPYVPIVRLIAIIPSINTLPALYLFYYLRKDSIIANGTSQQQITVPMVSKKRIIVPPLELLSEFERFEKPIWDEMDNIKKLNNELVKQRDLLLPRLMSGKLEV